MRKKGREIGLAEKKERVSERQRQSTNEAFQLFVDTVVLESL